MMELKEWKNMTSQEIAEVDKNLPVVVPVGLWEAHGPHLAVSVDNDTADYFARQVCQKTGAILAPLLSYGFSDEMREYPGSLGLSAEVFQAVIVDIVKNLCATGFKKVIFITGHGANKSLVELAFYRIWETYPDFKGACWNWWSDCGITGIHHADQGETEVALAVGTRSDMSKVKDYQMEKPWYKIRSRYALSPLSGGINGHPSEADLEHGKALTEKVITELVKKVNQAF